MARRRSGIPPYFAGMGLMAVPLVILLFSGRPTPEAIAELSLFAALSVAVVLTIRCAGLWRAIFHRTETLSRETIDHPPIIVVNQDVDLKITWVSNPNSSLMFGLTKAEIGQLSAMRREVLATGVAIREEIELEGRDGGGNSYYELHIEPIRSEGGRISGVSTIAVDVTARKETERKLALSESKVRNILASLAEGVFLIEHGGRVVEANDAVEAITGLSPEEVKENPNLLRHRLRDSEGVPLADDRLPHSVALLSGQPQRDLELRIASDAGGDLETDARWILVNAIPSRDEKTSAGQVVVSFLDITERKRVEQKLFDAASALDHAPVFVRDIKGKILRWTLGCDRVFGYSADEAVGRLSHKLLKPELPEPREEICRKLFKFGRWTGEITYRRADGTPVVVDGEWIVTRDGDEQPASVTEVIRDITERKMAEAATEEKDKEFRAAFERSSIGMVQTDVATGRVVRLNRRFSQMLGYEESELLGSDFSSITHPEDRKVSQVAMDKLLSGECSEARFEKRYVRKDGAVIWADLEVNLIRGRSGEPRLTLAVVQDITDRRRAIEVLQEADRRKDEFLTTLSHELRTPLTSILSWSQLLRSGKLDSEKTRQAIHTIEASAGAQSQLIEDLLDISRIRAGKLTLDLQLMDPVATLLAAIDLVRPMADKKAIEIETQDIAANHLLVNADPNRLRQVFWNLLTNAIKFTDKGGKITVRLKESHCGPSGKIRIEISDTGRGITSEFLPHIFDRFKQADSSSMRNHGGLGLGLALVRSLLDAQAGSIEAWSPGLGGGSTFVVMLPLADALSQVRHSPQKLAPAEPHLTATHGADSGGTSAGSAPGDLPLSGFEILLVDDEERIREVLTLALENLGAIVKPAASAREGLDALQSFVPDAIISDIAMPTEDGYAFIRQVRSLERSRDNGGASGRNVAAVALTAFGGVEGKVRALTSGFDDYMAKPVDVLKLARTLRQLILRQRERAAGSLAQHTPRGLN